MIKVPNCCMPTNEKRQRILTFRGPRIIIYSYNKSQRDALFLKFI